MTKEQLEQYTSIKEEIKELETELDKRKSLVSDIVIGSMEDYPYTQRSVTIRGLSSDTYSLDLKLTYKKIQLERQRVKIENFLDSVQDSKIRRIIRLKYIEGNTWKRTAFILGWHDEQIPRKKLERFLSKYEMYENTGI